MSVVEQRLREAGFEVPVAQPSVANYVPAMALGGLLFVSGQLPVTSGEVRYRGKVGQDVSVADGKLSAQLCALNILAQARLVLGNLERIDRCVRLGGFVNCGPDFAEHPQVVNGASDLIVLALGDAGRHTRAAVGCNSLPLNAATEVEAVFAIRE